MTKAVLTLLLSIAVVCHGLTLPLRASAPVAARAVAPSMLFGGGGKEGEGGGLNMMETIKKAQQVGVKVKELQEELSQTEIEAVAADGGVTVVISGAQVPISVDVTEELLAQGADAVSQAGAASSSLRLSRPHLPSCAPLHARSSSRTPIVLPWSQ